MGVHAVALATGDKAWLSSMLPALEAVATYMVGYFVLSEGYTIYQTAAQLGQGMNSAPGVFIAPGSGVADGGKHCSNWYDIIEFGHYVSKFNVSVCLLCRNCSTPRRTLTWVYTLSWLWSIWRIFTPSWVRPLSPFHLLKLF